MEGRVALAKRAALCFFEKPDETTFSANFSSIGTAEHYLWLNK